ncbi:MULTISPECIES: WbqC family protein [Sphingobacterium]|uniref:WbqC family protein n=1 Tax=Sphingobacterium TaxID=28453 RepID=UPI00240E313E|nr:WbqC family protein [Sphingobacterium sp. WM]WFB62068.1 WbqC family protein [Sphingobacterium sp. WM]
MLRKKIGIMQPYFFPYLGYISLIKHTDSFILLDSVQFIRQGWIERNRILKQREGWLYIQVPLKKDNGRSTLIKDCNLDNSKPWKDKILAQFQIYKKIAPNYELVMNFLNQTFSKEFDNITSLNKHILNEICLYLEMPKEISIFSEMGLTIEEPQDSDEWALNICKSLGEKLTYINPIGGQSFFDKTKYDLADVELFFHKFNGLDYKQSYRSFEPNLSIIDALMFNSKEEIHYMLDQYELV